MRNIVLRTPKPTTTQNQSVKISAIRGKNIEKLCVNHAQHSATNPKTHHHTKSIRGKNLAQHSATNPKIQKTQKNQPFAYQLDRFKSE